MMHDGGFNWRPARVFSASVWRAWLHNCTKDIEYACSHYLVNFNEYCDDSKLLSTALDGVHHIFRLLIISGFTEVSFNRVAGYAENNLGI